MSNIREREHKKGGHTEKGQRLTWEESIVRAEQEQLNSNAES